MTSEFIFDIIVKYKHTKEKQEEELKKQKEKEFHHASEGNYYPREHFYVLTQVKITTDYDIRAATLSAYKIVDDIGADMDKYVFNRQKDFAYWVVAKLGKFYRDVEY